MTYVTILVTFALVNNLVFTYFLGLCTVMDASRRMSSALGVGAALAFFLALSALLSGLVDQLILQPLGLEFLRTLLFVLISAAVVGLANLALRRISPALHQLIGLDATFLTSNCALLGIALIVVRNDYGALESLVAGASAGTGLLIAIGLIAAVRERLDLEWIPKPFRGAPIAFISAGLMAMAFFAFDRALLLNLFP